MVYLEEMTPDERPMIEALYLESFPEIERKPFEMLLKLRKKGKARLLVIHDEKTREAVGLSFFLQRRDMLLYDDFAIEKQFQSRGYGAAVLRAVEKQFPDARIFGEVEPLDPKAPNNEQRKRRLAFYLRNGMKESGIIVDLFGCELQLMYLGDVPITFEEYERFLRYIFGWKGYFIVRKNVHFMRMLPPSC